MTTVDPNRTIAGIEPGHHLCWLYQSQQEHRALLTPFLRRGLAQGERVIYVVDAHPAEAVLGYLRDDGLEPSPYLASGQLSILTADEAYLRDGAFDPDAMVALLRAETDRALADGYAALRVTGEMTWVLRGLPGSEALIEYESKLNEFFPGSKCLALCQYDRRRFEPGVLLDVLTTHRVAVVGTELFDNFYYVPPGELLGSDRLSATLRRQLDNLAERKRTAETLRRQREEQQIILDSVPAMIFHKDQENRLIRVNRAFAEAAGKARADMEGRTLFELYPDLADDCWRDDKEVMESGQPKRNIVQPIETPAGLRWLQTDKIPYRDAKGNTIGVIGFALDITERKRAEEEVSNLARFPSENPNPVFRIAEDGAVLYANAAAESLLSSRGSGTGRGAPDEWRKLGAEALASGSRSGTEVDHGSRVVSFELAPVTDAGYVNWYGRDITERKRAEEAAKRAQQQLLEQQRGEMERVEAELAKVRDELVRTTRLAAIGQVTASIAHELRNPLGSVRNAAYYLKRHLLKHEPGAAEYLGIIEQEVSAANLIITNLLAMARAREPTKQAVDLGQVVREAFAAIKGAEGVHCRVSLDPAPFLVQADPHQLQQILENLLKNAVQAMEGRGEVLVDATRNPDHDTILVRDSGPGVAAEVRESLFEPLVTTKPSGTGLGLAICRQIAAKHGGTVDLAAHEGAGAAFRVRLPRH